MKNHDLGEYFWVTSSKHRGQANPSIGLMFLEFLVAKMEVRTSNHRK